jgi:broad specificity phosphatase PhoE
MGHLPLRRFHRLHACPSVVKIPFLRRLQTTPESRRLMHLYWIRHGQSYINLPNFTGPFVDAGLTPLGQQQAGRVAVWLAAHIRADALYTSTMRRAAETAAIIAQATGLPAVPDDRLREVGNCWPDATSIDVDSDPPQYADYWASERPFSPIAPEGESWGDFVTRVGRFITEITAHYLEPQETVLVVSHGGVINAVLDVVFNVGHWRCAEIWIHNTGICHLEYHPPNYRQESWRLHGANLVYHLMQEDGTLLGYEREWQTT